MTTALTITLYRDDEPVATYSRLHVPWRLVKTALQICRRVSRGMLDESDIDALGALVVEAFGNRFTQTDLETGADVSEMAAIAIQIAGKFTHTIAPVQIERMLVATLGWSLREIDETDAESLGEFIGSLQSETEGPLKRDPRLVYADDPKASWL